MGFALCEPARVRIDVLRARFAARGYAPPDVAMASLSGVSTIIAWRFRPLAERSLANSSRASTPHETPLARVQVPWMLGWAWFALTAWTVTVSAIVPILRRDLAAAGRAIGTAAGADAAEVHA